MCIRDRYMEEQKKSTNGHNQDFSRLDSAGENVHLTGQQAVAFSRIRAIGNDYQRTERQRTVLEAMLRKVKSTTNVLTAGASPMTSMMFMLVST